MQSELQYCYHIFRRHYRQQSRSLRRNNLLSTRTQFPHWAMLIVAKIIKPPFQDLRIKGTRILIPMISEHWWVVWQLYGSRRISTGTKSCLYFILNVLDMGLSRVSFSCKLSTSAINTLRPPYSCTTIFTALSFSP